MNPTNVLWATTLLCLLSLGSSQGVGVARCDPSDPSQTFTYDAVNHHIVSKQDPTKCAMIATGCCGGELIRGGSYLEMQPCMADYESQKLSWPSATSTPPYTIQPLTTMGEPTKSTLPGNATLVFDARGLYFPGIPLLAGAYNPLYSQFLPDASGRLVNTATSLCLTQKFTQASLRGEPLNLQPCAPNKQRQQSGAPSTQLFTFTPSGTILTSEGLCFTAQDNTSPTPRLISATCGGTATTPFPSQAFNLSAGGQISATAMPGSLVADAGVGNAWVGARVPLTPNPTPSHPSSSAQFIFTPLSTTNTTTGYLTHVDSGMCLDTQGVPFGHGCLDASVHSLPFCDPTLPLGDRLADLVGRLTVEEATLMTGDAGDSPGPCGTHTGAIPRLDISMYRWLVEVSSMAATEECSTLQEWGAGCPTSFPAAMLLTGSFNRSQWLAHGVVVGDEMRAMNNLRSTLPALTDDLSSLAGHGPDINQPRDPRNGRNGELSTECPFLSGAFAAQYVRGMQFGTSTPSLNSTSRRMLASLKHYTAYSRETNRMGSIGNVSLFDLWDTYLAQYEEAMVDSYAAGTMCSYFSSRIEGTPGDTPVYVPSCANPYLLTTVVREWWGRWDATHLSDCGAVFNMVIPLPGGNGYTLGSFEGATAAAINAGMDTNSNTISPFHMYQALAHNLTTASVVYGAAARVLAQRFRLGHFDPLESQAELLAYGPENLGSGANRRVAEEGVTQGAVLLRHTRAGTLPLRSGMKLAVVGPTALSYTAITGDWYADGSGICDDNQEDCFPTVGVALAAANVGGTTTVLTGVDIKGNTTNGAGDWEAAIASITAPGVDAVVLCLGTDRSVAGEGNDRDDIGLPGTQSAFALAVMAAASAANPPIPVILLLVHNLPVSIDELLAPPPSTPPLAAIVDTWAPTSHCTALASLLFGRTSGGGGWGRNVLTVYPKAYQNAVSLDDMGMTPSAVNPGRSYKYFTGTPLFRFGEGLSGYSTFTLACTPPTLNTSAWSVTFQCTVTLAEGAGGDEVLMVFHRPSGDVYSRVGGAHPLPLSALVEFDRVKVGGSPTTTTTTTTFTLPVNKTLVFNNQVGAQVLYGGVHFLDVWNGNTQNVTLSVNLDIPEGARVVRSPPLPF